jgi:hypothetical protein
MTGDWKSAGEKPQTATGTKLAVLMRGQRLGESAIVEAEGFYLNDYPLHMRDGCECFLGPEFEDDETFHENGCPMSGFHVVEEDEDGEFSELYVAFNAVEWCKR